MTAQLPKLLQATALLVATTWQLLPSEAQAQERDKTWGDVSTGAAAAALATTTLMPRVFYAEPEVTEGWRARWHLSVLAPSFTQLSLAWANEAMLKDSLKGQRPGCNDENFGTGNCTSYGMVSSHSFIGGASLGQGAAIFLFDTIDWSQGRFNAPAFFGQVFAPAAFATLSAVGRYEGHYETGGQVLAGAGAGLVSGFLMGTLYATMQRPSCGYGGAVLCW